MNAVDDDDDGDGDYYGDVNCDDDYDGDDGSQCHYDNLHHDRHDLHAHVHSHPHCYQRQSNGSYANCCLDDVGENGCDDQVCFVVEVAIVAVVVVVVADDEVDVVDAVDSNGPSDDCHGEYYSCCCST